MAKIAPLWIAIAFVLAHSMASAQSLVDPMQPPEARAVAANAPAAQSGGLQGVLTSPRRQFAIIDGQVVPRGDAIRKARLIGLSDSSAVLVRGRERDVLLMHPNIDKRPSHGRTQP